MTMVRLALVLVALAGATACGARKAKSLDTPAQVAAMIRDTWGSTEGSPSFDYSCRKLDEHGHLFTCLVQDQNDWVSLARLDVVCDDSRCTWTDYPTYGS
jgi:hypothetical protein